VSGWSGIRSGVAGKRDALIESLRRPDERQLQHLQQIVERNRDTEFGRRYGFGSVKSIQDFQQQVPIHDYEHFRQDINRMLTGEKDILVSDEVLLFEATGGSTGGNKYLPFTRSFLDAIRGAILPWLDDLVTNRPGITAGKAYWAISPALRQAARTPGGIPIGMTSDAEYFGVDLAGSIVDTLAVPASVASVESLDAWRSATLQYLSACEDLSFISVWSPTFLLQLLDAAPDPIEWPALDTISCWCSSTSERYAAELKRRFPDVHFQGKGLLATEGVVTIPIDDACAPVLTVDSGFYEFETDSGKIVLPSDLETGASYGVVMTTEAGLYRYRLGDQVRVSGWYEATPCLEFVGRSGNSSDLCGEKLSAEFVEEALGDLPGFAFLIPLTAPRPAYILLLDDALVSSQQAASTASTADQRLMRNPQYRYARDIGQLPPIQAQVVANPLGIYKDICVSGGQRLGDIKPVALMSTDWGEHFLKSAKL
jgi:hypothetical protein